MKKHTLLTSVLLVLTFATYGQKKEVNVDEKPFIEVTGTAEKEIIPDEIFIAIVIREKFINKVKVTIEEQEEKLKASVKSLGIDLKYLSLADANSDYVKVSWKKKDVLTRKNYKLKVADAVTLGNTFQELDKLQITDAYISGVNHSKIDSIRKEIRILAIKAAKDKADYLLAAIGEKTGKPIIVTESTFSPSGLNIRGMNSISSTTAGVYIDGVRMRGEEIEEDIQFQKIKIESSIYVKFTIQ